MSLESAEVQGPRVPGGWFLPRAWQPPPWLVANDSPSANDWLRHVFTDNVAKQPYVRDTLVRHIREARKKVLFCTFILADQVIVDELCAAAERLQGGVYVLTALGRHMLKDTGDLDETSKAALRDERRRVRHNEQLRAMARAGVWVRSVDECHAKFCVVDDERAVVTSCNATEEAYLENPENGFAFDEAALARPLGRLFARVWLGMAELEQAPASEVHVKDRPLLVQLPPWNAPPETRRAGLVATLHAEDRSLLRETLSMIDAARDELVIASYSAVALSNHAVGAALKRALARGVRLLLVLQPRNHHEAQRDTCGWLLSGVDPERVLVRGHSRTHAKAIIADASRALLWTGNLDGMHGYDRGIEVGLAVSAGEAVAAVRSHVLSIARQSTSELVVSPTREQVAELLPPPAAGRALNRSGSR